MKELTAKQSWALQEKPDAEKLIWVDVRTPREWQDTGIIQGNTLCVSWRLAPFMEINPQFIEELTQLSGLVEGKTILFICRSGVRSQEAALYVEQHLAVPCINILGGMEGEGGWLASGLPITNKKDY